jgi:hypothetical protein
VLVGRNRLLLIGESGGSVHGMGLEDGNLEPF